MNHSINDNHLGTSRATPKDIFPATWTAPAIKSDFEPSRHHRSASGYPSGPDYVSSSRRHAENPTSGRDHKPRNVSESQPLSAPSHMRYRESHYADAVHPRSSHRKEVTADSAAYASASKRHAPDSSVVRNNNSAEDVIQYPRMKYERWIPPNQPSPPSHPQEPYKYEREGEKDRQRAREGHYRERRDDNDVREKHKRRYNEGDSDWDKDRERKERRERDRYRERERERAKEQERERAKEQERERAKEDLERIKAVKERPKGTDRHRDERDQERHAEKERQRAVEKEREKGRDRERDRDRERRRHKEKEGGQDRKRDRKDAEKQDTTRPKTDLDRERRKERELAHPEREHWHEVEGGRESDRDPLDRRKRKLDWESEKEREKVKEMSKRAADVPVVTHEGRPREVEHEGARKVQETLRRDAVEGGPIPSVVREQDIDRPRSSKKDTDSPRQRELQKVTEQLEADRARYTDKENLLRREHKSKRSARPYADRATDSEKENPSQRDLGFSNPHLRGTVLRGSVEPEPRLPHVPPKQARDERVSYASPMGYGATTRGMPAFSDIPRPTAADGHPGHILPTSRPTDPTLSMTPKYSPISVASAESQKMDMGTLETKIKQGMSSQRALRRQSKMSSLIPEHIAVLPSSHSANKYSLSHGVSSTRSDMVSQPPSSHVFRTDKEDVARLNPVQVPVDLPLHPSPIPPMVLVKPDIRIGTPMHKITSSSINNGSRSLVRNSTAIAPSASITDRPIVEISQVTPSVPRDLQGSSTVPGAQIAAQRPLIDGDIKHRAAALLNKSQINTNDTAMGSHFNDGDTKQRAGALPHKSMNDNAIGSHSANTATSSYVVPLSVMRNPLDKMGRHISTPFDAPASLALSHSIPPASSSTSNVVVKTSSRGVVKASNGTSLVIIEPETKVLTERNRVPQPGLMSHLETQYEPKRREPVADRVEIPMRRPPSAAAAGWPTAQGSTKETTPLESQQEQKRERDPVADGFNNTATGWPTVQSSTKETAPLETQQEQKRERAPVADNVYNASEVPLRRPTSAAGWATPQGSIRDTAPLEAQQEPKRQRGPVADNVSEPPLLRPPSVAGWSTLQGSTREMAQLEAQQELKRERVSVAVRVQHVPEAPSRIPSSAAGLPTLHPNVREVAHLEAQLEPRREKVSAAIRVQNIPEAPSRIPSSAAGLPTLHPNVREVAHLEAQLEPKREKTSAAVRVQNIPEAPSRIPSSAAGLPTLHTNVREVAHLEAQLGPKRDKALAVDRVQNAPEAPLRRPSSAVGWPTLQGSIREPTSLEMQQESKREKAPVPNRVQNAPEVPLRTPPSAAGWPAPQGSVKETVHLEMQQESKREKVADRVQNTPEVPLRRPPSVVGWSNLHTIREAPLPETQRELKRERLPVADDAPEVPSRLPPSALQRSAREAAPVPLDTQQELKRGRELGVDRAQNSSEVPSRIPPSAAGWSPQGNIREAVVPLEMQQEPKRERAPIADRTQNALEAPLRRPPSTAGWPTSQGSTRDKVAPTSNANAAEAPSYSVEQPTSIDVQLASVNSMQMVSSIRTTGFSAPRQEGLLSRVQTRPPIPENTGTSASNCPPPSIQPELSFQRNAAAPDRRSPPKPFAIPLTNLRSTSESTGTTLAPIIKTQLSKMPADEGARNGQAAGDSHPLGSANQENVPLSLPSQRGDRDGFNSHSREDQTHLESFQSSPATSLRRDASIQPSPSKPFNVVEVSQNVHLRPPASNHTRSHSSTTKVGEEPTIVASQSSSSKPSEEMNVRLAHVPLGRHIGQPDISTLSSTRIKGDRTSGVGQYIEQGIVMAPTRGAPMDDGTNIAPVDYSVPVISRDSGPKSTRHPRQTEHRHPPQTSLHQTIETHVGDALQRQIRDAGTDKRSQTQVNNHFDSPGSQEGKVHNHRTVNQASEDKKPTIQHEGLARILDQPFDRHVKKTGASPSTQSSHSGLPQEELQMPPNEVDRRHPNYGTPKTMPRSSSSMSHNTPSPVVKALSQMNHKSNPNQENIVQDGYNRPNTSATGYPTPSSLYPAVNSSTLHILSESSKNQAHALHTLPIHNHINSYQSTTIEAGQTRNAPSHQTNPLISHPPIPIKRPSTDVIENSDPPPSRHLSTQTKPGPRTEVTLPHHLRPSDVPSNSRTLDIANGRAVFNEAVRPDTSSRTQESNPGVLPAAPLLFSKSTDSHGPFEHKGSVDTHISTSSHPTRGTGNLCNSSPTSQELERHEPRLITPRISKHPELTEESRKKSHSLDVAKANPPDEVHKKSVSLDVVKSKSHEQRPHEIWYPPNRDDLGEGKTRPQPSSVAGPVANKGSPTALPAVDDQKKASTKLQHVRHGRKSPNIANMKVYRYLREKRNRTISAVSMEAQDGTSPSTVVGSPTASVISQAPIHIPSPRDPMRAAQDWLTEGIEAALHAEAQGRRRILRPGVVFDVGEDPPDEQRHRSKPSRSRAQNRRPQS